jgi:hypothetical protein
MPSLAHTQRIFWQLISAPEGVSARLAALLDGDPGLPGGLEAWIRGDDRLGATERLDVYAGMYFYRLLECLTEDFPAVHAVLGHEKFHRLARDYLTIHPSGHPSLRMLGRALGGFLETHAFLSECPYLADLARFEWALLEAFDAADASPVAPERLKGLAPDDWPFVRLSLTPSLRIVEAARPVQEVWAATSEGSEVPIIPQRRTVIRVWREDLRVFHRVIDEVELTAVRSIERGENFAAVCEAAAAIAGEERAGQAALEVLERAFRDHLIVGFETA